MKKIFSGFRVLAPVSLALVLLALFLSGILSGAGNTQNSFPEGEDRVLARAAAEKAGIDHEKYPASLITRRDLKDGERVTAIGMLREIGTARFPQVVITPVANFDIQLNLKKEQISNFADLYNAYVEVTGKVRVETMQYGPAVQIEQYSMTVDKAPRRIQ